MIKYFTSAFVFWMIGNTSPIFAISENLDLSLQELHQRFPKGLIDFEGHSNFWGNPCSGFINVTGEDKIEFTVLGTKDMREPENPELDFHFKLDKSGKTEVKALTIETQRVWIDGIRPGVNQYPDEAARQAIGLEFSDRNLISVYVIDTDTSFFTDAMTCVITRLY